MLAQDRFMRQEALGVLEQVTHTFLSAGHAIYLVGGSVRNLLLDLPCIDWDILVAGDATAITKMIRQLSNQLGGFYVPMHDKAERIVLKLTQGEIILDIGTFQASLEQNLSERDFTLNAIALALNEQSIRELQEDQIPSLIDPYHGQQDLMARQIRCVSEHALQNDPLRMLRAIRLMTYYPLTIEPGTENRILRDAHLLPESAAERIHDELYQILRPEHAITALRHLDRYGLLTVLIPELLPARGMPQPSMHHWDVFDHSLETVTMLELLTTYITSMTREEIAHTPQENPETRDLAEIQALLQEATEQNLFAFDILTTPQMKLAALLHDIGKTTTYTNDEEQGITFYHHPQAGIPLSQQITKRLALSVQDRRLIQQVVAHHMRPGQLSRDAVTTRAIRRYFVDLGPNGIIVALASLADHLAMRGPEPLTIHWQKHLHTVRILLHHYIRERQTILPPRLLSADELIRRLHLTPGPIIGTLLDSIAEAQAEGIVHSKEEALWFAEEKLEANQSQPEQKETTNTAQTD